MDKNIFSKEWWNKAFSYFGTIAKRYLIVYNENNYKKLQERADVDESDSDLQGFALEFNVQSRGKPK